MTPTGPEALSRTRRPAPDEDRRLSDVRACLRDSDFPADTDTVLALLVHRRSPPEVMQRVAALPWSTTFATLDDCLRYLRRP